MKILTKRQTIDDGVHNCNCVLDILWYAIYLHAPNLFKNKYNNIILQML